jgi:hypothetical protein
MRWYVEVSTIGDSAAPGRICVEAAQWQAALETARRLLNEQSPLSKFSIEVLDEGYRAVNPALRARYVIKRAPPNAMLTDETNFRPSSLPPASVPPSGQELGASPPASLTVPTDAVPKAPQPRAEPAYTPEARVVPTQASVDVVPPPSESPEPPSPSEPPSPPSEPPLSPRPASVVPEPSLLLRRHIEDATAETPMLYCEAVYVVAPGLSRAAVERVLLKRFREICAELEAHSVHKYVQLAVFDHEFETRPLRAPLATLAWKDWRGVPAVGFPAFGEAAPPPSASMPPRAPRWGGPPSQPPGAGDAAGVIRSVPMAEAAPSALAAPELPKPPPLPEIPPDES